VEAWSADGVDPFISGFVLPPIFDFTRGGGRDGGGTSGLLLSFNLFFAVIPVPLPPIVDGEPSVEAWSADKVDSLISGFVLSPISEFKEDCGRDGGPDSG